ncbi:MAG: hypothetical protein JNK78_18485 [Planctomycetes bacterium]|nr:hypothetical protein [Planctomycetota bacterium]
MALIPSREQWMKDTYSLTNPRSEFLQAVDAAILKYDTDKSDAAKAAIKTAFDRWRFEQSRQGKDWKKSVRNDKGACTNLHRALNDLDKRKLTKEEIEAMEFVARAQAMALQKQFEGKKLQFKSTTLVGMAQGVGSKWERFKTGAKSLKEAHGTGKDLVSGVKDIKSGVDAFKATGKAGAIATAKTGMGDQFAGIRAQIVEFCKKLCPDIDPTKIFSALGLGTVEKFATDLAPFVGAISSGGKAVVGWAGVAKTAWDKHSIEGRRHAIAAGDPMAAFDALLVLLQREIASKSAKAGVQTAAFTGKALGVFADGGAVTGPVIGLLETLADIFQTIVEYVRDYRECDAANKALLVGALNLDLFETSPVLGCYFLCVQDHSTIINFAVADYGTTDFVFDVEALVKKVEPVLERARAYIGDSRLEIPGMENAKGIAEKKGTLDKIKEALLEKLESAFLNKDKGPVVDKARIQGYGHQPGGGFGTKA